MYKIHNQTGLEYYDSPEIYCIARTLPCESAIKEYMTDYDFNFPYKNNYDGIITQSTVLDLAARHCTMSFKDTESFNKISESGNLENRMSFLHKLLKMKHLSIFEHISFTFLVRGISRYCTHELVRHRHLSFSQTSTRYTKKNRVVLPYGYRRLKLLKGKSNDHMDFDAVREYKSILSKLDIFMLKCKEQMEAYNSALEYKDKNDDARFYLPSCLEAPIVVSGNLRAFLEAGEKRISKRAAGEINDLFIEFEKYYPQYIQNI